MNWYKENIALQNEPKREYPAVSAMIEHMQAEIDRLKGELKRYQSKYNNLLAVAHRDGGHYLAEHGEEVAGEDAISKILAAYHANDYFQGGVEGTATNMAITWDRAEIRKQTAREIVEMLRADRWAESELEEIKSRYGLEG